MAKGTPAVDVDIQPMSLNPINVMVRRWWSIEEQDTCWYIEAKHYNEHGETEAVQLGSVPDCYVAPEPSFVSMIAIGVLFFAVACYSRSRRPFRPSLGSSSKRPAQRC